MDEVRSPLLPCVLPGLTSYNTTGRLLDVNGNRGASLANLKKRGHGSRSWIKIDQDGNSEILALDKATIMRNCLLPARDLRLLDPLFIYPSTILGREKAIVVSLEQIRCIITADEVILMNSLDRCVVQYNSELCKRLETNKDQPDDLPFEFRALELALELTCISLDAQVTELELELYPIVDELVSSINTLNLERVRRLKGHLLALTQRVQKVHDEIEHLMDDDGDMAEMYLTEKKQRLDDYPSSDLYSQTNTSGRDREVSKSAPVSPVQSISGTQKLQRAFSSIVGSSKHGSTASSSSSGENIDQLEMLLEAYFVVIDNTLSKLLSLKEYVDDTEDLINIKLGNVQNRLIQFELLLSAATFVATIFAVVTGVFGMNFEDSIFDHASTFNWVLVITGSILTSTKSEILSKLDILMFSSNISSSASSSASILLIASELSAFGVPLSMGYSFVVPRDLKPSSGTGTGTGTALTFNRSFISSSLCKSRTVFSVSFNILFMFSTSLLFVRMMDIIPVVIPRKKISFALENPIMYNTAAFKPS